MSPGKATTMGGEFWSDGYFASTVGKHGDEQMIAEYVKDQGNHYLQLHRGMSNWLFFDADTRCLRRSSSFSVP